MNHWKFYSEWKPEIPLPPDYTFPQAFNYLNPESNSFYILESPAGDYLQCGGSKERCTIELRRFHPGGYTHYVLGRSGESESPATIRMSRGDVSVQENEVFGHWSAIDMFKRFFAGEPFPNEISYREVTL